MAIAGSGGWVSSAIVIARNGNLLANGLTQNKPADCVYSDSRKNARGTLADAVVLLSQGKSVEVEMTNGQFIRLLDLWTVRGDTPQA